MLWLCHDLIALRRAEFGGRTASYRELPGPPGRWTYQVEGLLVAANFTAEPSTAGDLAGPVVASSAAGALDGGALAPWSGVITRPGPAGPG